MWRSAVFGALFLVAPSMSAAACSPATAEFRWDGGGARFSVEIADDDAERARGLMFRETLGAGQGMLFVYQEPQPVAFWMKNTLAPLDMIFLDGAGRVTSVHENAVPGDLTPILGPAETLMVLEIGGGLARRIGLSPGAVLRHPSVPQSGAIWACD